MSKRKILYGTEKFLATLIIYNYQSNIDSTKINLKKYLFPPFYHIRHIIKNVVYFKNCDLLGFVFDIHMDVTIENVGAENVWQEFEHKTLGWGGHPPNPN